MLPQQFLRWLLSLFVRRAKRTASRPLRCSC